MRGKSSEDAGATVLASGERHPDAAREPGERRSSSRMVGRAAEAPRTHLDLRMLSQFVVIARAGNMTAAAREMGLSTPAVSQLIQRVERELGITVLARTSRGVRLTPAGHRLYEEALAILSREAEFLVDLEPFRHSQIPRVSLHVVGTIANYIMPAIVEELRTVTGEVSLRSGRSQVLVQSFLRRDIDVLVSSEIMADVPGTERHHICREEMLAIAPASLPPAQRTLEKLAASLPLIRFAQGGTMDGMVESYLHAHGLELPRFVECTGQAPILELVSAGMGWSFSTPLSAGYFLPLASETVAVPLPPPAIGRDIYLVAHADRLLDIPENLARTCRRVLRERMRSWRGTQNEPLLSTVHIDAN